MAFFKHQGLSSLKHILLYVIYIVCLISIFGVIFVTQQRSSLSETNLKAEQTVELRKPRASYEYERANQQPHYYYEEQRPVIVHAESFTQQDDNDAKKKEYLENYWRSYPLGSTVDASTEDKSNDNNFYYTRNYLASMNNRASQQLDQDMLRQEITTHPPLQNSPHAKQSSFNNFLAMMGDLKKLWDIYNAFSAALNSNQIHSNQTTPLVIHPRIMQNQKKKPHTEIGTNIDHKSPRSKYDINRNKRETPASEIIGRYIKGDPLKGYYDFVISEGSYKFWAVFQVGTAILIIYSTFAAIYYSKVNPLTTDYDYTDYLGGARGFPADDIDFDDVGDNNKISREHSTEETSTWYSNLTPNIGGVLINVLELVDKLPINYDRRVVTSTEKHRIGESNSDLIKNDISRKKLKRQIFNSM